MKATGDAAATRFVRAVAASPRKVGVALVRVYQCCISPRFPACCRYVPSCSHYAIEAIERFGLIRGVLLACARVARCHPFHAGGYDPVPQTFELFSRRRKS